MKKTLLTFSNILIFSVLFPHITLASNRSIELKGNKDREISITVTKSTVEKFQSKSKHKLKKRSEFSVDAFDGKDFNFKNGTPTYRIRFKDKKKDFYDLQIKTITYKEDFNCGDLEFSLSKSTEETFKVDRKIGDKLLEANLRFQKALFAKKEYIKYSNEIETLLLKIPNKRVVAFFKSKPKNFKWVNAKILSDKKYVSKEKIKKKGKVKYSANESFRVFPNGETLTKYDIEFEADDTDKLSDKRFKKFACDKVKDLNITKKDLPQLKEKDPVKKMLKRSWKK